MLMKATAEDIKKYGEWAYSLALNPIKSGYPTYGDGIKTKADFLDAAKRAVAGETSELLMFRMDGNVEGWLSYFWISEDKYLQLDGFCINRGTHQALTELMDMLGTRFTGYTAYFGYAGENRDAIEFLQGHDFKCIEQAWNHSFFFDGYVPAKCAPAVEKVSRQNFHKFRAVYHADPETYWNCERIFERIDDGVIFVYNQDAAPAAAVFLIGNDGYFEIYGIEFADGVFQEKVFRELLTSSLGECKRLGAKYMTYLCKEEEKHILAELGFKCVGQYVLYSKTL